MEKTQQIRSNQVVVQAISQQNKVQLSEYFQNQLLFLQDFIHFSFPNLQVIVISKSYIEILQPFCLMKAPQLKRIHLNENNITSLKSIRKIGCSTLQVLNLKQNRIIEAQYLNQLPKIKQSINYQGYQTIYSSWDNFGIVKYNKQNGLKKLSAQLVKLSYNFYMGNAV